MSVITNITDLAQDVYFSVNGAENDDTGADLTIFQDNFIRAFNLWLDEYETETYWNVVRTNDYVLATIADVTTYSFDLPTEYRTPVFDTGKYIKFVSDGIVISKFRLVNPNQRVIDDETPNPDRATFTGDHKIVLSRVPTSAEVGATIELDVIAQFPKLTRTDDTAIDYLFNKQIAVLGIAKNQTLSDVTKVSLTRSFSQRYSNELAKAIAVNIASNETDYMRGDDHSSIGGIW